MRRKLAAEFATAARLYQEAAVSLASQSISHDEYVRLRKLAQEGQNRSEAAFISFEEHVDLHRCCDGKASVVNIAMRRRRV